MRPIDADALLDELEDQLSKYPEIKGGGFAIGGLRKGLITALRSLELDWRGSKNQRVIDVRKTLTEGHVVEWEGDVK